ncbi:MAG: DUF5134 domain-containing protein [Acidimicrobiales bacterium]|jgi:hypothetical protein
MSGPTWLADLFAAVMILVAVYSAGRLLASWRWSRPTHADIDITHILMGVAMAGMLVSAINPIPTAVWEFVFVVVALWFIWRCYGFTARHGLSGRDEDHVHHLSHYVTHVVMALAMLYMYLAASPTAGSSAGGGMGMTGATGTTTDFVGLPLLFLFVLLASAVWELDGAGRWSPSWTEAPKPVPVVQLAGGGSPVRSADRPPGLPAPDDFDEVTKNDPSRRWLAPGLKAACHIAMCVTMGYMLIVML